MVNESESDLVTITLLRGRVLSDMEGSKNQSPRFPGL